MAVTLKAVNPHELRIGKGATEVFLLGEELDTDGLEAGIMDVAGHDIDTTTVVVEQPLKDDTSSMRFPITATALDDAGAGYRKIVIKHKKEQLDRGNCPKGSKTCDILSLGIELK